MDADLESQDPLTLVTKFSGNVTDGLYDLTSNIKAIRRLLVRINTPGQNIADLENRLGSLTDETFAKLKTVGQEVKILDSIDTKALSGTHKLAQEKLSKDFRSVLKEFKSLQKESASRQRAKLEAVVADNQAQKAALEAEHSITETTPLVHQQLSAVLDIANQQEVDFQQNVIADREHEITIIESGISEINSIFRDLGSLVNEQGAQVDVVEENISSLATHAQSAHTQLHKANEYQKKRGKWSYYMLIFLVILLLIVVLIVL